MAMVSNAAEWVVGTAELSHETRAEIRRQFIGRLSSAGSPLVGETSLRLLLSRQVDLLLRDLGRGAPADGGRRTRPSEESLRGAAEFSRRRACLEIHPTETVRAAGLFYELALPVLLRERPAGAASPEAALEVALDLHDAVMTQIALGCVGYITFLREKIHSSHRDERRRIARDLHDRVSHEILVALLSTELCDGALERDPELARTRLKSTEHALREALQVISELSGELRDSTSGTDLERSLGQFLESAIPEDVEVDFATTGDVGALPTPVTEELYYMLREAVRNALRHSAPRRIRITLRVSELLVQALVSDDGRGFDLSTVSRARHDGLTSIRERSELLGGSARIRSTVGGGTTVGVSIPLVNW
ncbi:sensor histidine kinase [Streptomyces sp. NPDC057702]|uniref:sensor histidine kinase n=1 Tax=unclassified Streptomyces TaxID=2593676 RepID=UPI0036771207